MGGSVLTRLKQARYLGSHPRVSGQVGGLTIEFRTDGLRVVARRKPEIFLPWSDVRALDALDASDVDQHATARKRTVTSFLVVTDAGGPWIFAIPGLSPVELRSGLQPLQGYVPEPPPEDSQPLPIYVPQEPQDRLPLADRLALLDELLRVGAISQDERDQQRARLLDSI
jgi:hypothetical protein